MGKACAVYILNENRLYHKLAEASICSLRMSASDCDFDVVVLTDCEQCDVRGADKTVNIRGLMSATDIYSLYSGKYSPIVWVKMLVPLVRELDEYDRALIVDSDILFKAKTERDRGMITRFFTEDFGGRFFMATLDYEGTRKRVRNRLLTSMARVGFQGIPDEMIKKVVNGIGDELCAVGLCGVNMSEIRMHMAEYMRKCSLAWTLQPRVKFALNELDWMNLCFSFVVLPYGLKFYDNAKHTIEEGPLMHYGWPSGRNTMYKYAKRNGYLK